MTMSSLTHRQLQTEIEAPPLPGHDARELVPDASSEAVQAIKDIVSEKRPSSVLGVLVDRMEPVEVVTVAAITGAPLPRIQWTIEVLVEEGFCRTYMDDGIQMVDLDLAQNWI